MLLHLTLAFVVSLVSSISIHSSKLFAISVYQSVIVVCAWCVFVFHLLHALLVLLLSLCQQPSFETMCPSSNKKQRTVQQAKPKGAPVEAPKESFDEAFLRKAIAQFKTCNPVEFVLVVIAHHWFFGKNFPHVKFANLTSKETLDDLKDLKKGADYEENLDLLITADVVKRNWPKDFASKAYIEVVKLMMHMTDEELERVYAKEQEERAVGSHKIIDDLS